MSHRTVTAFMLFLLATGCAELRWHKDSVSVAALEQDLGECRRLAWTRASHLSWPFGYSALRFIGVNARGRPIVAHPYRFEIDRFLLEHDLTRLCMRGKGYELAPVEKQQRAPAEG